MAELLDCVEIGAETGEATGAVVWLHGLGADGHDFEPIVPMLQCPHLRFVFPHAPSLPVTINGGLLMPAWYDITTLEPGEAREDAAHIRASAQRVVALLDREQERGLASARVVLAGFSQGGAMALHVGQRYPKALAGLLVLSAYQVLRNTVEQERVDANRGAPGLFCHGTVDPLVPCAGGRGAYEAHSAWSNGEIAWREFPIGHEVSVPEIEAIGSWLRAVLP